MRSVRWTIPGLTPLLLGGGGTWAAVAVQGGIQSLLDVAILHRDITR